MLVGRWGVGGEMYVRGDWPKMMPVGVGVGIFCPVGVGNVRIYCRVEWSVWENCHVVQNACRCGCCCLCAGGGWHRGETKCSVVRNVKEGGVGRKLVEKV